MIDSHCHIGFENDILNDIVGRAKSAGICRMLSVACAVSDYDRLLQILADFPMIEGAVGLHPEYAASWPQAQNRLAGLFPNHRLVAVGEFGLDYHYAPDTKLEQRLCFEGQIELAHHLKKPIIIHTRDADADTISILESADRAGLLKFGGVLHCFTGTQTLAEKGLEMGLYLSASGVITFKNADGLRSVFQMVPNERLLIETDSPYLAPVPYRGQKNEPAFVIKTAEKLAELKKLSVQEIDQITTENYYRLFHVKEASDAY